MHLLGTIRCSSSHPTAHRPVRRGFSLIEMVVVIAIIGVLAALILPAVMRVRESGRRIQCLNNIRQVGMALQTFESTFRHYPVAYGGVIPRDYAPFARLLPYLEQDSVYNSINFTPSDPMKVPIDWEAREAEQAHFARVRVDVFLCPSDPYARGQEFGGTNYRINTGTYPTWGCQPYISGPPDPPGGDGFFYGVKASKQPGGRQGAIRDGLSTTVAFAERLVGSNARGFYPEGNYFTTDPQETGEICWSRENWIRRCRSLSVDHPKVNTEMGHSWLYIAYDNTAYNHVSVPNSPIPDCGWNFGGVVTSRSWHRGGVNVSMGDGQARFISERISLEVWRALGTRNSHEVIDATAF